jgi:hypothetical protein
MMTMGIKLSRKEDALKEVRATVHGAGSLISAAVRSGRRGREGYPPSSRRLAISPLHPV